MSKILKVLGAIFIIIIILVFIIFGYLYYLSGTGKCQIGFQHHLTNNNNSLCLPLGEKYDSNSKYFQLTIGSSYSNDSASEFSYFDVFLDRTDRQIPLFGFAPNSEYLITVPEYSENSISFDAKGLQISADNSCTISDYALKLNQKIIIESCEPDQKTFYSLEYTIIE